MTLSTHVLDATTGRPAAGVEVRLDRAVGEGGGDAGWAPAGAGQTDADGRLRLPSQGGAADFDPGSASFYPEVTITFEMTARDEHYHVPLLLSPFAYSTYRGS